MNRGAPTPENAMRQYGRSDHHPRSPKPRDKDERLREILDVPGRPIDCPVRQNMEARFGHSLEDVCIRADERAAAVARSLDASAFTTDNAIVSGRYATATAAGSLLLAHELAHVAHADHALPPLAGVAPETARAESRADRAATCTVLGNHALTGIPGFGQWGPVWDVHREKITKKGKVKHRGEFGRAPDQTGVPHLRDESSVTMFDDPGGGTVKLAAEDVFNLGIGATSVTSTAHFETFLITDNAAAYVVRYRASTTFTKNAKGNVVVGAIGYTVEPSGHVSVLPSNHKKMLDASYPAFKAVQ
jgi:hypothetical protein